MSLPTNIKTKRAAPAVVTAETSKPPQDNSNNNRCLAKRTISKLNRQVSSKSNVILSNNSSSSSRYLRISKMKKKKTTVSSSSSMMKMMMMSNMLFKVSSVGKICLAVMSFCFALSLQRLVLAEQQVSHLSHSQNALFKDLSGPTSGKIQTLDVICGKNFMTVRAEFSAPFYGIVFSKGTYGQENCIYVKPNSGLTHAAFNVYYDQCGTKPDLAGKFYENTIVIQYGSDIIEAYDEAKRLRCEWFEAYEKPATFKPAIPVADLEVVEMNFQGDDIDCWMEIQDGAGPWSREVSKIVPVGQPMTIVVAINDYNGQFDMRVKSCVAHDGQQQPIALTDEFGCVLRPKMLTPFTKIKNPGADKKATVLSYSRFLAFKFPDSMTVQIQCTVEVCRHGCADACQRVPSIAATTLQPELSLSARWPANSNQPALAAAPSQVVPHQQALPPHQHHQQIVVPQLQQPPAPVDPYRPPRVQFQGDNNQDSFRASPSYNSPQNSVVSAVANNNDVNSVGDDMSSSDSNHLPTLVRSTQQQQVAPTTTSRRSQEPPMPLQYASRRVPPASPYGSNNSNRPIGSTSTTSTSTTTSTTTTSTTTTASPRTSADSNRSPSDQLDSGNVSNVNSDDQTAKAVDMDSSPDSLPVNSEQQQAATATSGADNKAEASQPKPTIVSPPEEQQSNSQLIGGVGSEQSSSSSAVGELEKPPSVQADEVQPEVKAVAEEAATSAGASAPVPVIDRSGSSSSLKTVEVEIPVNEDPVRSLMGANSAQSPAEQSTGGGLYNPTRLTSSSLNNVDLNANYGNYNTLYDQRQQSQNYNNKNDNDNSAELGDLSPEQVIQPRENIDASNKRGKGEESSSIEAMLATGKARFGARSPAQQVAPQAPLEQPANHYSNHQMSTSLLENRRGATGSAASNDKESLTPPVDKLLIDRSDDSASLLTEIASSASESMNSNSDNKPVDINVSASSSSSSSSDESSAEMSAGSKIQPVVGTEELASGPLQIEDRIGASAQQQESLEEALTRLQQQIPQSAALVKDQQQAEQKAASGSGASQQQVAEAEKPDQRADQQQVAATAAGAGAQQSPPVAEATAAAASEVSESRVDLGAMIAQHNKKQQMDQQVAATAAHNQRSPANQREINQPHPNIAGQSKVIPDPNSNLNARGSMIAQASSSVETSVLPSNVNTGNNQQQIAPSQQQQQQQQQLPVGSLPPQSPVNPSMQQAAQSAQSKPIAQITNVPIAIGFPQSQIPAIQQQISAQQFAYLQQQQQQLLQQQQPPQQQQQQQQQQQHVKPSPKPARSRFNLLSPQAALHAVASRFLPKSNAANHHQQQQQQQVQSQLPILQNNPLFNNIKIPVDQQQQKLFAAQQQQQNYFLSQQQPQQHQPQQQQQQQHFQQYLPNNRLSQQQQQLAQQQLIGRQQQPLIRSRRSAIMPNGKRGNGEVGITKTFMVVTGMDLAFMPNLTDTELPPILEGRRMVEDDVVYGVCMPVVGLTYVLTCAFWLIVFIAGFCIYTLIKAKRQRDALNGQQKLTCSSSSGF